MKQSMEWQKKQSIATSLMTISSVLESLIVIGFLFILFRQLTWFDPFLHRLIFEILFIVALILSILSLIELNKKPETVIMKNYRLLIRVHSAMKIGVTC